MASPLEKHLERAEKALSKNKTEQAIEEFEAAHKLAPSHVDVIRNLADLYARLNQTDSANRYNGLLFDRYFEQNDAAKAIALYHKNLEGTKQPPERLFRFAALLHRQSKTAEAVAAYKQAAHLFEKARQDAAALQCLEKMAALDPESAEFQVQLAQVAQRLGKAETAAKAYLRAGQLVRADKVEQALEFYEQAQKLCPNERSILLSYAQAQIAAGKPERAVDLLLPLYVESEQDPAILSTLGEALLVVKRFREAEEVLEIFYQAQPDGFEKLFDLAALHLQSGQVKDGLRILSKVKERLYAARRQRDFVDRMDTLYRLNQTLMPLVEFTAETFNEANQEARYSEVLGHLFKLYLEGKKFDKAIEALQRMIDVDPYDFENQKRLEQLKGKVDAARYNNLAARIGLTGGSGAQAAVRGQREEVIKEEEIPAGDPRKMQSLLEDLLVQVEIFLQYSLQAKAVEKLQRIAELFPGEEATNERLRKLYEQAQYFPKSFKAGAPAKPAAEVAPSATAAAPAMSAETVSDLAKISEITHGLYRQGSSKNVIYLGVSEVGKYLQASRCLGVLGRPGAAPNTAVEYCALGVPQSSGPVVMKLLGLLAQHDYVAAGSLVLDETLTPELQQVGAKAILAVPLLDKEKQEQAGVLVVAQADSVRKWKPNEVYLLQAVADQVIIAVNHTRLRTLMKTMGVADETTGLVSRSNYIDCLVSEATRAKSQGTPLALTLIELDKGGQLIRQLGEPTVQRFMQQAGETVVSNLRQSDIAVKYTATSLALVLPDTTAEKARTVVEKMRKLLVGLKLADGKSSVTFSVGISEAKVRPDFDVLDTVTDVINRAEFSLEAARKEGGKDVVL